MWKVEEEEGEGGRKEKRGMWEMEEGRRRNEREGGEVRREEKTKCGKRRNKSE